MKKFYTRVQLKYDTWANWSTASTDEKPWIPLKGEVCLVEVPVGSSSGLQDTPPSVLMKVGDGVTAFHKLPWLSALAADVHSWAKKSETDFKTWLDETAGFATDAELAAVNSAVTALGARVSTAEGKITTLEGTVGGHATDISDLKAALGMDSGEGDTSVTARVKALEDSVGTPVANADGKADGTAYERIAKNAGDISTINSKLNIINGADTVDGSIAKALKDAKAYSDSKDSEQTTALQSYADGKASAAETAAKSYADGLDTEVRKAFAAADTAINARVTTLVGSVSGDDSKSARAIAAEEVAKVVDGAPEALDTLKEIATWIGNDTMSAASIVANLGDVINEVYGVSDDTIPEGGASRIDANATAIATEKSRAEGKEAELLGLINDLRGNGEGSVSDQITDAIDAARTEWEQDIADANTSQDTILKKYADDAVGIEKSARESAVAGVQGQIDTLNGADTVAGSVAKAVKEAKQAAIDAAASDATTKANNAKTGAISEAKDYTDGQVSGLKSTLEAADATIKGRLDVLEEKVDITKDTVDARVSAAITTAASDATTKANNALNDAKAYADGLKTTIGTEQKAITDALDARLDTIESTDVTKAGSIAKAVNDEKLRAEGAESALAGRATALEGAVGASTDAANASGTLYARVAQNKADIASEVSRVNGIAARPFVAVESNDVNNYVIFYCGTASEMI